MGSGAGCPCITEIYPFSTSVGCEDGFISHVPWTGLYAEIDDRNVLSLVVTPKTKFTHLVDLSSEGPHLERACDYMAGMASSVSIGVCTY